MQIINELEEHIDEEICDAKKYAELALKYKTENKSLADLYYTLANEEMGHMSKLHEQVVSIIEAYKKEKGEPPADMMAVYNFVHKKDIEKSKDAKMLIAMYKEN